MNQSATKEKKSCSISILLVLYLVTRQLIMCFIFQIIKIKNQGLLFFRFPLEIRSFTFRCPKEVFSLHMNVNYLFASLILVKEYPILIGIYSLQIPEHFAFQVPLYLSECSTSRVPILTFRVLNILSTYINF